jgi:hypothetical protein
VQGLLEVVVAASLVMLPPDALVVEQQVIPTTAAGPRAFVLWMLSPQTSECSADEWAPSCPGSTRGCYLRGPTRVSLIDPVTHRLINTLNIVDPVSGADSFDVPRKLYEPSPYHVGRDHQVRLLWLQDMNGDGAKTEFELFDAMTCSDLFTALLGYSARQDRLIWYRVRVTGLGDAYETEWPETLFSKKPTRGGVLRYVLAWPGDEALRRCEAHYVPDLEAFETVCRTRE